MTSVFIHAGLHKTATTLVQRLGNRFRRRLKEHGIYYPKANARDYNHNSLVDHCDRTGSTKWIKQIYNKSLRAVGESGRIFLSAENLEYYLHKSCPEIIEAKLFRLGAQKVTWIFVFRDPYEYYSSLYSQLSTGGNPSRPQLDYIASAEVAVKWGYLDFQTYSQHQRFIFDYKALLEDLRMRLRGDIVSMSFEEVVQDGYPGDSILRVVSSNLLSFGDLVKSEAVVDNDAAVKINKGRGHDVIEESYIKRFLGLSDYSPPIVSAGDSASHLNSDQLNDLINIRLSRRRRGEAGVKKMFAERFMY